MFTRRITCFVLVAYLLVTCYAVIVVGLTLPQVFPITQVSTFIAFTFTLLHSSQRAGWRNTILLAAVVFLTGLAFESVGVATGWIYGPYHYTDKLGVKFLNLVPLLIPLAWTMMMYPSFVIADRLVPISIGNWRRRLVVAAMGGIIMTAWDVAMDPLMVLGGFWVWEVSGPFFGVPLQNYWGWWLTTFVALLIYLAVAQLHERPGWVDDHLALLSYLITASSTVIIASMLGLGGPALAGIFAMAPWLLYGWISKVKNE